MTGTGVVIDFKALDGSSTRIQSTKASQLVAEVPYKFNPRGTYYGTGHYIFRYANSEQWVDQMSKRGFPLGMVNPFNGFLVKPLTFVFDLNDRDKVVGILKSVYSKCR
jgi:hypothetical protein